MTPMQIDATACDMRCYWKDWDYVNAKWVCVNPFAECAYPKYRGKK